LINYKNSFRLQVLRSPFLFGWERPAEIRALAIREKIFKPYHKLAMTIDANLHEARKVSFARKDEKFTINTA
jgi:hypothetical protein